VSPRLTEEERREAIVDSTLDTIAGAVVSHMLEARVNADQPVSHTPHVSWVSDTNGSNYWETG
jgi:hypothetical protein